MRKFGGGLLLVMVLVVSALFASGCNLVRVDVGPLQTDSETVEAGTAESVRVEINLGAGELDVSGGASELLDAEFTYNVERWTPEVDYSVSGSRGQLVVKQPTINREFPLAFDDVRYEWDLRFSNDMPLDLVVNMGAGEGRLDLGSLNLKTVDFDGGAGGVQIDLTSSTVEKLDVSIGAGNLDLDLSGDWAQDMRADINGGVGSASLRLPADAGVRVEVHGGLGEVNAHGFNRDGDVYTNAAYGDSAVTLDIQIDGGVGSIDLRLVE